MYTHLKYRPAVDSIAPVLEVLGHTRLTKYPYFRIYKQFEARLALLDRLYTGMCRFAELNTFKDFDSELRFYSYFNMLNDMKRYVEDCHGQLDILNTIDCRPIGDMSYSLIPHADDGLFKHTVLPFTPLYEHWKKYMEDFPTTLMETLFSPYVRIPEGCFDDAAKMLYRAVYQSRKNDYCSRLQWELKCRHEQGWYMVFDTLTFADDKRVSFDETPNALRDYFRSIGNSVLQAEGRSVNESSKDCYSYFCVPEYGTERGRLHFHCIHFCRTLPLNTRDPNIGCTRRNRRQVEIFKGKWSYGHSMPIALRYHNDAFSRRGWLWPLDDKGVAIKSMPVAAIGFYVTKYIAKNLDTLSHDKLSRDKVDVNANFEESSSFVDDVDVSCAVKYAVKGEKKWNKPMSKSHRNAYRVRMSRHLGQCSLPMQDLSIPALLELAQIHYQVSPYATVIRRQAKKQLVERMRTLSIAEIQTYSSAPKNLLHSLRSMMKDTKEFNVQSSIPTVTRLLPDEAISDEARCFIHSHNLDTATVKEKSSGSGTYGRPK